MFELEVVAGSIPGKQPTLQRLAAAALGERLCGETEMDAPAGVIVDCPEQDWPR